MMRRRVESERAERTRRRSSVKGTRTLSIITFPQGKPLSGGPEPDRRIASGGTVDFGRSCKSCSTTVPRIARHRPGCGAFDDDGLILRGWRRSVGEPSFAVRVRPPWGASPRRLGSSVHVLARLVSGCGRRRSRTPYGRTIPTTVARFGSRRPMTTTIGPRSSRVPLTVPADPDDDERSRRSAHRRICRAIAVVCLGSSAIGILGKSLGLPTDSLVPLGAIGIPYAFAWGWAVWKGDSPPRPPS